MDVYGAWTVETEPEGNYEARTPNQQARPVIGDYPDALQRRPETSTGRCRTFQAPSPRVWSNLRF